MTNQRYNWEWTDFRDSKYQLDALDELLFMCGNKDVAIRVYHMLDTAGLIHHDDLVDLIRWDKRGIEKTIARYIMISEEL